MGWNGAEDECLSVLVPEWVGTPADLIPTRANRVGLQIELALVGLCVEVITLYH
jgi:hypothetical protein